MRDHVGWVLALALAFAALLLRLAELDAFWLNFDEGIYWSIAHRDLEQAQRMVAGNAHPPLYYYLLRATAVFGDGVVPLRAPSAVFGAVAVFAGYLVGRQLHGRLAGWLAAAMLAFAPGVVRLSTVARPYMAQLAFALLALWCLSRALQNRQRPRLDAAGFATFAMLALLTHYSSLILVAAVALALLPLAVCRRLTRAQVVSLLAAFAALGLAGGLLYVFHIAPHMLGSPMQTEAQTGWLQPFFATDAAALAPAFLDLASYFAGGAWAATAVLATLSGAALCAFGRTNLLALLVPSVLLLAATLSMLELYPFGGSRHSTYLLAVLVPAIACGFARSLTKSAWTAVPAAAWLGALLVFHADANRMLGAPSQTDAQRRETFIPMSEIEALLPPLRRTSDSAGLLLMDASTASTVAALLPSERPPVALDGPAVLPCWRWGQRIVLTSRHWSLASGFQGRGEPGHLGRFLDGLDQFPVLAQARDTDLLILTGSQIDNGGGRQSDLIQMLPPVRAADPPTVLESLHRSPNFHLFRLDAGVYAAMLAALPR